MPVTSKEANSKDVQDLFGEERAGALTDYFHHVYAKVTPGNPDDDVKDDPTNEFGVFFPGAYAGVGTDEFDKLAEWLDEHLNIAVSDGFCDNVEVVHAARRFSGMAIDKGEEKQAIPYITPSRYLKADMNDVAQGLFKGLRQVIYDYLKEVSQSPDSVYAKWDYKPPKFEC